MLIPSVLTAVMLSSPWV